IIQKILNNPLTLQQLIKSLTSQAEVEYFVNLFTDTPKIFVQIEIINHNAQVADFTKEILLKTISLLLEAPVKSQIEYLANVLSKQKDLRNELAERGLAAEKKDFWSAQNSFGLATLSQLFPCHMTQFVENFIQSPKFKSWQLLTPIPYI